ncbi:COG4 transport protein-domain-containing protein [Vararia minispora EC-137]|uniref:COG4 transport protein-domain-containing protein n=1 Tax=Vararia minispora EC-137 TaxID=1314806 RepID=A0ACB8QC82_9AGAM|nr:COG4 transport protein-domain-containing protein [Vararia minispora EC-137]
MNGAALNGTEHALGLLSDARPPPSSLTTLPQILASLSSIESEEAEVSNSLADLLSAQEPILTALRRLQSLAPALENLHGQAVALSSKVSVTAHTADRVGGRVRVLDEEMRRVREAGERVGHVMELKSSLSALQSSIDAHDWESATRYCARAMILPDEVKTGAFAESAVPTAESHLPPTQTLQNAREYLLNVFRKSFAEASQSRDAATTTRFFKLFPVIGWEEEGLEAYASFVVDLVKVRPPASAKTSSPLYYITALTALFESIAMIVDQHQPVVEKYYGPGKMASVITRLLQECDRVAKGLIEGWEEERQMERKLSDVASVTFMSPSVSSPVNVRRAPQAILQEEVVDQREIDKVITEAAGMASRWHLFRRFLYDRLNVRQSVSNGDTEYHDARHAQQLKALDSSTCNELFDNLLAAYYTPLEVWYIRSAVDKAHRLSTPDLTLTPSTTTLPDDTFYILKLVLGRLLSTGAPGVIERTAAQLRDALERDYAGVLRRKMDDVYRTAGNTRNERETAISFITLLNDLDVSASHMERLVKDVLASPALEQNFLEEERAGVSASISSFSTLVPKFRSILRAGVEQLFNQLMRPRLRTFIGDVYKDVSYVLDENAYATAEYQDIVRKRFVKAWDALIENYKDTFSENNFRLLFGLALDVLIRPWEKFIMNLRYSELGAIRFDRDLRAIATYLSSQTAFGDVREKFVRLQQIATLLNLDQEEDVDEFYNSSGVPWKLSEQEARVVSGLRT